MDRRELVIAVELKITAPLDEHQNPEKIAFKRKGSEQACRGYGCELIDYAKAEDFKRCRYITVEERPSWNQSRIVDREIDSIPRWWNEFIREERSEIEVDVYDTLASLGIGIFLARKMKNKTLCDGAGPTEPFALLKSVFEKLRLKFGKEVKFQTRLLKCGDDHFGCHLLAEQFRGIKNAFAISSKQIGWFGYQLGDWSASQRVRRKIQQSSRHIELYCDKSQSDKVKRRVGDFATVELLEDQKSFILEPTNKRIGDLEWFVGVLSKLNEQR